MNERINELFGQALDQSVPETWTTLNPAQLSKLKAKFAELIVRECVKEMGISKQCDPYTGEVYVSNYNRAIDDQISMLIEHFGVE